MRIFIHSISVIEILACFCMNTPIWATHVAIYDYLLATYLWLLAVSNLSKNLGGCAITSIIRSVTIIITCLDYLEGVA